VLFAGGAFKDGNSTTGNIMQAASVSTNFSDGNQYIGLKEIKATLSQNDAFPQAERAPLYPLQLFDLGRLGIEAAFQNNGVFVTKTTAGKPLTKAGVRQGDQIMAIDGKLISSVADVRRRLRRKAPSDMALIQLTRGLETMDIEVRFKED
jgi:S1-C subfamily serine protease